MNISHSELACFRRCTREHHYRYRLRVEPLIPAESLVRGRRQHQALASWWSSDGVAYDLDGMSPADRALFRGYSLTYQQPHLANVRVNVPFRVELSHGLHVVGELDAMGVGESGAVIVEHKTTGSDIRPGSAYWREVVHTAPQASTYLLAFPGATVLWDALHKPQLRKLRAGKPNEETDAEFEARCLTSIAEEPERYYQRTTVVRLEEELKGHRFEMIAWSQMISQWDSKRGAPRNPDACWHFGRPCDFFGVCWEGRSLNGPEYVHKDKNHTEEVFERTGP